MLPLPQANGDPAPSHSGRGELESSNVITAPAICGTTPRNAADLCCWVVPVLPAIGRSQPTWRAAPAAVPEMSSRLSPVINVLASPGSTAWSQPASLTATGLPSCPVTDSIGEGGHHRPALARVAPTLASSNTLVGLTPSVNEACRWSLVTCAIDRSVRLCVFGST